VCSAAGQLFIYYTIATFGPVVFVIIMTIRQVKYLMFYYINGCEIRIKSKVVPVPILTNMNKGTWHSEIYTGVFL
jgi:hypothetical protein